jgi:hypothetical protein
MKGEDYMRSHTLVILMAIVLIAIGIIALAYQGITYTRNKTVLNIGPIEARVEEKRTIPLPPVLGALAIAGGITLLIITARPSVAA